MNFRIKILQRMAYRQLIANPAILGDPLNKMKTKTIVYPSSVTNANGKAIEVGDIISCPIYPEGVVMGEITEIPNEITVKIKPLQPRLDHSHSKIPIDGFEIPIFIEDIIRYYPKNMGNMTDNKLKLNKKPICMDCDKI